MTNETQQVKISAGHTPGPWDAIWWDTDGLYVGKEDTSAPVDVVARVESNNEADARLIAAAPDLLEALEGLFRECVMIHRFGGDADNTRAAREAEEAARAAIRKARGEGGASEP